MAEPAPDIDSLAERWEAACAALGDRLNQAGQDVIARGLPASDTAEGLRYVVRTLRHSLERTVEDYDPRYPWFWLAYNDTVSVVASNPDYAFYLATIDGELTYRVRGTLGDAPRLNIASDTMRPPQGHTGGLLQHNLDEDELDLDADGNFELTVSPRPPASGPWLRTGPLTDTIQVRNIFTGARFAQHRRHKPVKLQIECLDAPARRPPYRPERLLDSLAKVTGRIGAELAYSSLTERCRERGNGVFATEPLGLGRGGDSRRVTQTAFWQVSPGQALVIDLPWVPRSLYWSLVLTNVWTETLDLRFHDVYLSSETAILRPDGSLRIVVCGVDPGRPNWVDTAGHTSGTAIWRWLNPEREPVTPVGTIMAIEAVR
jgi:hypothetical protein